MAKHDIVHITDKLANTINSLYKIGVFASVLGSAGVLVMLGANIGELSPWFLMGLVLTSSSLVLLLFTIIKAHLKMIKTLKESKETIDAMQNISLQVIRLTGILQTYSFKKIDNINQIIQLVRSQIESIPFLGDAAKRYGLSEAGAISQTLVENAEQVENLINKIEEALINGDYEIIGEYSNQLSELVSI